MKALKKISVFLALMFILHQMIFINVFAASDVSFTVNVEKAEDKLTYTLCVSKNSNIAGLSMVVTYPKDDTQLIESKVGKVMSSTISSLNDKTPGKMYASFITTEPICSGGDILTLIFKGKSEEGISIRISECVDSSSRNLRFKVHTPGSGESNFTEETNGKDGSSTSGSVSQNQTSQNGEQGKSPPTSSTQENTSSDSAVSLNNGEQTSNNSESSLATINNDTSSTTANNGEPQASHDTVMSPFGDFTEKNNDTNSAPEGKKRNEKKPNSLFLGAASGITILIICWRKTHEKKN